jgi:hypothetical protein
MTMGSVLLIACPLLETRTRNVKIRPTTLRKLAQVSVWLIWDGDVGHLTIGQLMERSPDLTQALPSFFFLADVACKLQRRSIMKTLICYRPNEC